MRACDVENINDFRKYYTGWLGIGENPTVPIKFKGADNDKLHFFHLEQDKTGGFFYDAGKYIIRWEDALTSLTFGSPYAGMVVTSGVLYYGSVRAERQWQRGFRPDNTNWINFNDWGIHHLNLPAPSNKSYDVLWQIFNPKYDSLAEGIKKLEEGITVGSAIDRLYGLYTLPSVEFPILAYKRWTIGYVLPNKVIVLGSKYREYEDDIRSKFQVAVRIE